MKNSNLPYMNNGNKHPLKPESKISITERDAGHESIGIDTGIRVTEAGV